MTSLRISRAERLIMVRAFAFALLASLPYQATAGKVTWFELHRESYERVLVCPRLVDAMAIAATRATRAGDEQTEFVLFLARQDTCQRFNEFVIFRRLIFRMYDRDGNIHSVYEAAIRGVTVYVPLTNQDHRTA